MEERERQKVTEYDEDGWKKRKRYYDTKMIINYLFVFRERKKKR